MNPFKLHRAQSLEDAADAFQGADEARFLAGGQTLIPVLKQRLAAPSDLVSLAGIDGLSGITANQNAITVGAMTRHADVAANDEVKRLIPALAELAGGIGDPHVRNRGTMGGSLANNDPAADYPAAVLGLGARVVTDRREIGADDYFQGLFTTALEDGELIVRIVYPVPEQAGYVKMPHPASRYCLVGVMVSRGPAGVRVAVTGAGQGGVFRVPEMEARLAASFTVEAIAGMGVPPDDMMSDIHAGADYRAHLVGVLARRAVAKAIA
ncbi:MAG: xanthine dehydrogenase family protein subunit M [Hyphomicrobiaceae bacterium]